MLERSGLNELIILAMGEGKGGPARVSFFIFKKFGFKNSRSPYAFFVFNSLAFFRNRCNLNGLSVLKYSLQPIVYAAYKMVI